MQSKPHVVEERRSIEAVYTIPDLLLKAEQVEAELDDYKMRLGEDIKALKNQPRFHDNLSYASVIDALSTKAAGLRREAQNRARTPNQMVFAGMDDYALN